MMRLYAEQGIATVVMTNATGFGANQYLNVVDAELLR